MMNTYRDYLAHPAGDILTIEEVLNGCALMGLSEEVL